MNALVLEKENTLIYQHVEQPACASNEVLIKVKAAGICGSDVHGLDGTTGRRIPPVIMGHEASGVIEELGADVEGWSVGDRVTFDSTIYELDDWYSRKGMYNLSDNRRVLGVSCDEYHQNGAFAEYVVVPEHILYRIPEDVTFEQAALVEPAAVALHAVELVPIRVDATVVVVGVGIIGLLIIQMLKAKGCGTIIAVDLSNHRLKVARQLGASHTINAEDQNVTAKISSLTNGRGADIALEAVGIEATVNSAIHSLRKGGSLVLVGNLSQHISIPLQTIVTREIRVQGSCAINGEYPAVLNMMAQGKLDTDVLISVTAPLREGEIWFKRLYDKEDSLLKVILTP